MTGSYSAGGGALSNFVAPPCSFFRSFCTPKWENFRPVYYVMRPRLFLKKVNIFHQEKESYLKTPLLLPRHDDRHYFQPRHAWTLHYRCMVKIIWGLPPLNSKNFGFSTTSFFFFFFFPFTEKATSSIVLLIDTYFFKFPAMRARWWAPKFVIFKKLALSSSSKWKW